MNVWYWQAMELGWRDKGILDGVSFIHQPDETLGTTLDSERNRKETDFMILVKSSDSGFM